MKKIPLIFLLVTTLALLGCGEKKEEKKQVRLESTEKKTIATPEEEVKPTGEIVEVTIEGDDRMQFDKKEIRVQAGQTVKLTLVHTGNLEKNVMGHNWVLLKKGVDVAEFANKALTAAENDYVPPGSDAVITHTPLIGGGESVTIEFIAPERGTYDYICSFPGHYAAMRGKFIVE